MASVTVISGLAEVHPVIERSTLSLLTFLNASTKSSLLSQKRLRSRTHVECVSGLLDSGWCTLSLFSDNSPHLSADAVLALNAAAVIANIKLQVQQRQKDEQRQTTSHTATTGTPDFSWPLASPSTNFTWNTLTFSNMRGFCIDNTERLMSLHSGHVAVGAAAQLNTHLEFFLDSSSEPLQEFLPMLRITDCSLSVWAFMTVMMLCVFLLISVFNRG